MIFSCKKIRNRSPTLSQVVHFHPSIQRLFWGPKNTPGGIIQLQPHHPQLEGPGPADSIGIPQHPASDDHRQGTLRLRQNRPRSRELPLRCYDLLSYTTPGGFSVEKFFWEENFRKTWATGIFGRKKTSSCWAERRTRHTGKKHLCKKKTVRVEANWSFFGRGYSTFWGWMIEKL